MTYKTHPSNPYVRIDSPSATYSTESGSSIKLPRVNILYPNQKKLTVPQTKPIIIMMLV